MKLRIRGAFTLVELLASMVLTTVLMLAIFQVLASVARQGRAMAATARTTVTPWQTDLVSAIRWDLVNANSLTADGNQLIVQGHGSLDRATLTRRHAPVEVSYTSRRISGRNWLVRRETSAGASGWSALVCSDVEQFEIRPANPELVSGSELAARYVLRMKFTDGEEFTESIVLR